MTGRLTEPIRRLCEKHGLEAGVVRGHTTRQGECWEWWCVRGDQRLGWGGAPSLDAARWDLMAFIRSATRSAK